MGVCCFLLQGGPSCQKSRSKVKRFSREIADKHTNTQTHTRTDGRYQVHYLPRFAVDKNGYKWMEGYTNSEWMSGLNEKDTWINCLTLGWGGWCWVDRLLFGVHYQWIQVNIKVGDSWLINNDESSISNLIPKKTRPRNVLKSRSPPPLTGGA